MDSVRRRPYPHLIEDCVMNYVGTYMKPYHGSQKSPTHEASLLLHTLSDCKVNDCASFWSRESPTQRRSIISQIIINHPINCSPHPRPYTEIGSRRTVLDATLSSRADNMTSSLSSVLNGSLLQGFTPENRRSSSLWASATAEIPTEDFHMSGLQDRLHTRVRQSWRCGG